MAAAAAARKPSESWPMMIVTKEMETSPLSPRLLLRLAHDHGEKLDRDVIFHQVYKIFWRQNKMCTINGPVQGNDSTV